MIELNQLLAIKQLYSVIDNCLNTQMIHFEAKPYKSDYTVFLINLFNFLDTADTVSSRVTAPVP